MAHISLYRRFRPATFDEMVRQEHVVRVLKNQIKTNAVGHAYLFCGPRGTGKTSVARIFARAVNCEKPVDGSPCGKCPTCLALADGSLDIVEIDAASNNGVNEMRDLREKVQYPPVTGKYKVYIIDEVHMLTDSAFNALLKTLEEPPAHAVFILATTEPHKIPATILSRCMRLDFKLIPTEDLEAHLKKILSEIGKEYEEEAVAAIARAGAGSDRDMLSIAETCIAYSDKLTYAGVTSSIGAADFKTTAVVVEALLHSEMPTAIEKTERILAEGKSVGVLLRDILDLLSQISVIKTCTTAEKILSLPKELYNRLKEIAEGADGRALLRAIEIFSKTENELRYASSPRIVLEAAIMRVAMPEAERNVEALLVRLSELERRLAAVPMPLKGEEPLPLKSFEAAPPVEEDPAEEFYSDPPLMEEPVYDEAFYAPEPVPPPASSKKEPRKEREKEEKPAPEPMPSPAPVRSVEGLTAQQVFGQFMRTLRKTCKNGVLFTMCADLMASYSGSKLVLSSDVETVVRALGRPDNRKIMDETFALIGVTEFEVRYARNEKHTKEEAIESLKKNFSDYPVEVK